MSNLIFSFDSVVCLALMQCRAFTVKEIGVHEPVSFPCPGNCSHVLWTRFIPTEAGIAECHRHTCRIEQHCPKRFAVSGDVSRGDFTLRITSAAYNDAGSYKCTCDRVPVTEVKLKVYGKWERR